MCGRYTLFKVDQILEAFPWIQQAPPGLFERYNIAPTEAILAIANNQADRIEPFRWGLIPFWAKDPKIGSPMINARAETLGEKPAFRNALLRRRCLVPADGFYEWKKTPGVKAKTPMHIRLRSGALFAFAGLWETWRSPDGSVIPSCTLITTQPNELMAGIHDRMPVILKPADYQAWLDPAERDAGELAALLQPYPAAEMEARPVAPPREGVPIQD